ncbi:MAG: aminotransferase class V-fold PLP-dependent enzyme, partial [Pirellulales bacterium]
MSQEMRRYLDNAATSWPKPESVYVACAQTAREIGVAAGRGGYREAIQGNQMIKQARSLVAEL